MSTLRRVTGKIARSPGWRVFLFLAMIAVPAAAIQVALVRFHLKPDGEVTPGFLIGGELASVLLILGATAVMGRLEGRSGLSYGLAGARPFSDLTAGAVGGFISLTVLVGVLSAGRFLLFDGVMLRAPQAAVYGVTWLFAFLLVGMAEETIFRGYLQTSLSRWLGFWKAAAVLSVVFALVHLGNRGETVLGLIQVVVAGLLFCVLLRVSGSLWLGIGFHATWDWSQSYVYGVADSALMFRGHLMNSHPAGNLWLSGGSAGPEGSALAPVGFVLCPLLLIFIWWAARRRVSLPHVARG